MPLTAIQIETLFAFMEKKSVRYYDLQVELVDHLASSIEAQMEKNGTLTFDNALQKVYNDFVKSDFAHVVKEKQIILEQQRRTVFWKTVKWYFTAPKIAFTILLFTGTYLLAPLLPGVVQQILVMYGLIYTMFVSMKEAWRKKKTDIKPLLLTQVYSFYVPYPIGAGFIIFSNIIGWQASMSPIAFAFFCSTTIILHLVAVQVYYKVRQQAKELYPKAFIIA
jgi:hypothetical protein